MASIPPVKSKPITGPALVPLGHHEGKPPIPLMRPVSVIGSRSNARIHLISSTVSKAHALLVRSGERFYIRDLASRSKLIINGEEVREADLADGDRIQIGSFEFQYVASPGEARLRPKRPQAAPGKLEVSGADFPVPIDQRVMLIGRRSTCDIHLLEESVSTAHAVLFEMDGQRFVRDLGSRTGTFVNGVSTHQHCLSPGDVIRIGETELQYLVEGRESAAPPRPRRSAVEMLQVPHEAATQPPTLDLTPPRPLTVEQKTPALGALDLAPAAEADEAPPALVPAPELPPVEEAAEVPGTLEAPAKPAPVDELPILPPSIDVRPAAPALSETHELSAESFSIETGPADKHVRPVGERSRGPEAPGAEGRAADGQTDQFQPRRGWRNAPATDEAAAEPANQDLLKFPDSISAADDTSPTEGAGSAAVLDRSALGGDQDVLAPEGIEQDLMQAPPPIGHVVEEELTDLGLTADLDDLIAPPPAAEPAEPEQAAQPEPQPQAEERPQAHEPPEKPVPVPELQAVDFSHLDLAAQPQQQEPVEGESGHAEVIEGVAAEEPVKPLIADTLDQTDRSVIAAPEPSLEVETPGEALPEPMEIELPAAPAEPISLELSPPPAPEAPPAEAPAPALPVFDAPVTEEPAAAPPVFEPQQPEPPVLEEPASPAGEAPALPEAETGETPIEVPVARPASRRRRRRNRNRRRADQRPAEEPASAETSDTAREIEAAPETQPAVEAEAAPEVPPEPEAAPAAQIAIDLPAEKAEAEPPVEILDSTEPTPESALEFSAEQLALDEVGSQEEQSEAPLLSLAPPVDELSDTTFDRALREFTGDELGEIIEPPPVPEPPPAPESPAETPALEASSAEIAAAPLEEVSPSPEEAPALIPETSAPEQAEPAAEEMAETPAAPAPQVAIDQAPEAPLLRLGSESSPQESPAVELSPPVEALIDQELLSGAAVSESAESPAPPTIAAPIGDLEASAPAEIWPAAFEPAAPIAEEMQVQAPEVGIDQPQADSPAAEAESPEVQSEVVQAAAPESPALEEPPAPAPVAEEHAEPAMPPAAGAWGANQENYLGGVPLDLRPAPSPSPALPIRIDSESEPVADHRAADVAMSEIPITEEVVGELMDEVESAAAAAGQTSALPAPAEAEHPEPPPAAPQAPAVEPAGAAAGGEGALPVMPAIPPRPRRVGRPPRHRHRDESIPPYKGKDPTRGGITTGFDGLAMPPVRQVDVFSQMSPPAIDEDALGGIAAPLTPMDLVEAEPAEPPGSAGEPPAVTPGRPRHGKAPAAAGFEGMADAFGQELAEQVAGDPDEDGASPEGFEPAAPKRRAKVRPALGGPASAGAGEGLPGGARLGIRYVAEQTEAEAAAIRRRYLRRVPMLLGAMLLLSAASALAIYYFLGVNSAIEASVTFKNLGAMNKFGRDTFQAQQYSTLKGEMTRLRARQILKDENEERGAKVPPDFLDDQIDYFKVAERAFFRNGENRPDVMTIRRESADPDGDKARVKAMAVALYEANESLINEAARARSALASLNAQIEKSSKRVDELNEQIRKLQVQGESRPTAERIKQLEEEMARAEQAWNASMEAVKSAQADLARIKASPGPASAPSVAGAATPAGGEDEKVKAMAAQLGELQARLSAARSQSSEKSAEAKKELDSTLDAFQKQVAQAQEMMKGNPELAAYVAAAQQLQQMTRQLTDELIRRQEQQFSRLTELKERLNEKMDQRRIEGWQNDKELQELAERLAILTRQHNAALGGGLAKEADDLQAQIDLTKNMIKARQDLLPGDSLYADALQQLQVIIDSTKKNIDEDRRKTEQLLSQLQQGFVSSQPKVEQLPAEQKQIAEALEKQLAAINAARQQYNSTVDAGADDSDAALKSQIATLQAGIDARRKQLADENLKNLQSQQEQQRLAQIASKEADLARLNKAEAETRQAYFGRYKDLREAQAAVEEARAAGEQLDQLKGERKRMEAQLQEQSAQVKPKQDLVAQAVEPLKPNDSDVKVERGEDRRFKYSLISIGGLFAVFAGLILWTLHKMGIEAPALSIQATDLRPITPVDGYEEAHHQERSLPPASAEGSSNGASANSNGSHGGNGSSGHDDAGRTDRAGGDAPHSPEEGSKPREGGEPDHEAIVA